MAPIREKPTTAAERIGRSVGDTLFGRRKPRQLDDVFDVARAVVPTANADRAVANADAVLLGPPTWVYDRETRTYILRDPQDANNASDVDETAKRFLAAQKVLSENAVAESRALDALSEDERAQYLALKQQLLVPGEGRPQGDPVAVLALQKLLLQGRLPGVDALAGGQNLLESLYGLTSAPLADGIDRTQMMSDLVQELATPESINQNGPTCVATATQIHLIQNNPAEFVRLFTGLASPEGRVTMAGGEELVRDVASEPDGEEGPAVSLEPGTDGIVTGPEDGDTQVQEIMGAALTEYANGDDDYTGRSGLDGEQANRLAEQLLGQTFELHEFEGTEADEAEMAALIERARAGESFFVGVRQMDGYSGHKLLVTGIIERDGEEYVTYVNPWGRVEAMPLSSFETRVRNANVGA